MNKACRALFHALQHKRGVEELRPLITTETAKAPDDFYQLKPLLWALSYGASAEVLKLLLAAHPEAANEVHPTDGWTPLHYAERLDIDSVRLLLERCPGAAAIRDAGGMLPLHWAAEHNAPTAVAELLLEAHREAALLPDSRGQLPARLALDAGASSELVELLERCQGTAALVGAVPAAPREAPLPVAILFPGQGSQYVGMLRSAQSLPAVQEMLREANEILGYDLLQVCLEGPEHKLLESIHCQPALYLAGLAGLERVKAAMPEVSRRCQAMAGFSVGQYAALAAAGVFSFGDGLRLVKVRAEAMQEAASAGQQAMLSVAGLDEAKLERCCAEAAAAAGAGSVCQITAHLFQRGFTVGGTRAAVELCKASCQKAKAQQVRDLRTGASFHTPLMAPARAKLEAYLLELLPKMSPPRCKVYVGAGAEAIDWETAPKDIVRLLLCMLTECVHWKQCMAAVLADGVKEFVECGPLQQLKAMMKRIDSNAWGNFTNFEV